MPAYTGDTMRLDAPELPNPNAFTPGLRALALQLATAHPDTFRIDSFGVRDDDGGLTLMIDLSATIEHVIDDPALVEEFHAWQAERRRPALASPVEMPIA